jgi:hypothetical protein
LLIALALAALATLALFFLQNAPTEARLGSALILLLATIGALATLKVATERRRTGIESYFDPL